MILKILRYLLKEEKKYFERHSSYLLTLTLRLLELAHVGSILFILRDCSTPGESTINSWFALLRTIEASVSDSLYVSLISLAERNYVHSCHYCSVLYYILIRLDL